MSVKRTQHCWPTTPNVVRCYMMRSFAHPVACYCAKFETGQNLTLCKRMQQLPSVLGVVGQQCFVRLHGALDIKQSRLKPRENGRNIFGQQLPALMGLVTSFAHRLTTHENFFTEDSLICDSRLSLKSWYSQKRYTVDIASKCLICH